MAVLAPPVQVVASGAPPFVHVPSGAPPFVAVAGLAPPIMLVADGAPPITLLNEDGSIWTGGAGATPVGGAALLTDETDGFATDFGYATDASRVAVKVAGVNTSYGLDGFYSNASVSPKQVFDVAGNLVWSAHNMFLNSAAPVTQTVTTVVGQNYTVTIVGSGSMTGSSGAAGVATAGAPLTYTATGTSSIFTKAGTVTQIQMNRGAVATAYIATTAAIKNGLAVDYDPVTHVSKGLLCEIAATNLLLNNTTLSTQSVTVTAVAHTLSFLGTGTITLTGVSTAGPLVGTGVSNRVSLTFTPTAGSLTLTVSGTVSNAQLETGTIATSVVRTFAATVTRASDNYTFLLSTIPALGVEYSMYCRYAAPNTSVGRYVSPLTDGTGNEVVGIQVTGGGSYFYIIDGGALVSNIVGPVLAANTPAPAAFRIKLNDVAISWSGGAISTDTAVTVPTTTEIRFANNNTSAAATAVFYVEKLMLVPRGWSNTELVAKSAT